MIGTLNNGLVVARCNRRIFAHVNKSTVKTAASAGSLELVGLFPYSVVGERCCTSRLNPIYQSEDCLATPAGHEFWKRYHLIQACRIELLSGPIMLAICYLVAIVLGCFYLVGSVWACVDR